ncbi:MAG TPA: flagellin [Candidatus Dormibacteraeota bacterium]|nr:flagellin [Candidatus Dormibacteraeota bacterium]
MDVLRFGDWVALGQNKTYADLSKVTQRLSSGLRISSAADDPSGLAISQRLLAQANGFQTGQQSIQSAVDLLQTAEGGLQTIADILQRMRSLVVEANSSLDAPQQISYLQTELNSLAQEVNTISGNTQFNGQHLLDGSLSPDAPAAAQYYVPQNDTLASGQQLVDPTSIGFNPSSVQAEVSVKVTGDLGAPPPSPFNPSNDLLNVQVTVSSADPSFGAPQVSNYAIFAGTNIMYVPFLSPFPIPLTASFTAANQSGTDNVASFNLNAISAADIGKQFFFYTVPAQNPTAGHALSVNDGGGEGHIVNVDIPGVNARDLGVSEILLGTYTSDQILAGNPNLTPQQGPGSAGDVNFNANQAAEYRLDHAISLLAGIRAKIGAQTVSLQHDATDIATQQTQLTAAASSIRDANVGSDVTSYTRDQVLVQVQNSVLHSLYLDAQQMVTLVQKSFG